MIWGLTDAERLRRLDRGAWQYWWAWRPVQLNDGRWAWLQKIVRRRECIVGVGNFWTYGPA